MGWFAEDRWREGFGVAVDIKDSRLLCFSLNKGNPACLWRSHGFYVPPLSMVHRRWRIWISSARGTYASRKVSEGPRRERRPEEVNIRWTLICQLSVSLVHAKYRSTVSCGFETERWFGKSGLGVRVAPNPPCSCFCLLALGIKSWKWREPITRDHASPRLVRPKERRAFVVLRFIQQIDTFLFS
jgi:hypothetical protein